MSPSENNITILDVGHGNSTIIMDESDVVIIDTGAKSTLLEFLSEHQILSINTILLSHADKDHIGGLLAILASGIFHIQKVRLNTDSLKGTDAWDDLVYELDKMREKDGLDFRPSLTSGDKDNYNTGKFIIQILGPSSYLAAKGPGSQDRKGRKITTNSISAVIRILNKEQEPYLLLPGDVDEIGLEDIIEHGLDLRSPTLVFPHHGGMPGSNSNLKLYTIQITKSVKPTTVIFSLERDNRYRTPRPEIICELFNYSRELRIMCTELSNQCASQLPHRSPTHLNCVCAKGQQGNKCCAGTIIISYSSPNIITPLPELHQDFIKNAAPNALCSQSR